MKPKKFQIGKHEIIFVDNETEWITLTRYKSPKVSLDKDGFSIDWST